MVSQKLLSELKQIVEEEYNIHLTEAEVNEIGNLLIATYDILTQNVRKEESE